MLSLSPGCHFIMCRRLGWLLLAAVMLGAPMALGGGQAHQGPPADPWSVYSWGVVSANIFSPPSCHQLSYFSRTPSRFNSQVDPSKWPRGSFTQSTKVDLLGTIQKHRIYQVLQFYIHPDPQETTAAAVEVGVKRILVERHPNEFCMIFEEEGTLGPAAEIVEIDPATVDYPNGEPVIFTHDLIPGTGGATIDGAWILENGVPVSLLDTLSDSIGRALKEILPPGCAVRPNRNGLDLEDLSFRAQVWPNTEGTEGDTCDGEVELKLGVRNHKLVVLDKQYRR